MPDDTKTSQRNALALSLGADPQIKEQQLGVFILLFDESGMSFASNVLPEHVIGCADEFHRVMHEIFDEYSLADKSTHNVEIAVHTISRSPEIH